MSDQQAACQHRRGEYREDYQHCLECGREVVLIGGAWFEVQGWVRVHDSLLDDQPLPDAGGVSK